MDQIDKVILRAVQEDAKINVKEIASELGMTKTPVYERLKKLEKEGIISKYVAIVDSKKITPSIMVFCSVSLDVQKLDRIKLFGKAVNDLPEVVECYLTGGAFDFLLKVVVRDLDAYHEFSSGKLAALPNVSQIKSSFVLNELKHSTVFPMIE